ncbi:uncharacterized protein LOC124147944 [Haliotis rufescens]|uniref:uncharacterized protein LOC124147944 n=1 Tax=Haliotis rufescens TaxID=6454 RepID=UPI00201FB0C1|nr:uncharacterized protein LOC124147944 [Haliotis rufescens]
MGDTDAPFVFSSPPSVPRERGGDILVKVQAVSSNNPCLLVKSYRLYSKSSVLDVRKKIQQEFNQVFENGFVFLCKNREILTSNEKALSLSDVLPKAGLGKPTKNNFQYPSDVSYKDLPFEKDGRRYLVTCIGLLFLFDASGVSHWNLDALQQKLDARSMFGFSFIPTDITSARPDSNDSVVEELSQYAAIAKLEVEEKSKDHKTKPETSQIDYGIYKEKIECLLQNKGRNVREEQLKDQRLATPLHYAAQGGHLNMCQFLCMRLDKYKLMYEKDINGRTPLHCALYQHGIKSNREHLKVAAYLLSFQPDLDSPDVNGMSCYYMILSLKKEDTVYLMKQLDPDIIDQKLVLHFTCCALQYKELKHALRFCEVVPTVEPTFLRPPLHLAAEFGNLKIIQNLLNGGHSVLDRDPDGHLPFHYACQHNKLEFVKLLINKDMNTQDVSKGVRLALNNRNFELIGQIADMDVDMDLDQETFKTLLTQAQKNLKCGQSLLKCFKTNPEQLSQFVGQAAYLGLTDLLVYLLKRCPPDSTDSMMRTPLHDAVQGWNVRGSDVKRDKKNKQCLNAFKLLVNETKTLNVVDWRNSTPLHYACMEGNLEFVKFMLSQQDLSFASVRDSMGRTPLLLAAHYKKGRKVLDYMINHHLEHLDPYAMDAYGKNILHYVGYMNFGLIDVLLRKMKKLPKSPTDPYKAKDGFPSRPHGKVSWATSYDKTYFEAMDNGHWKCRFCEATFADSGGHFCEVMLQTLPPNTCLSPLETLIIMNKPETLKKLVTEMPNLLDGEDGVKARFCAVRLWRLRCADVLMSSILDELQYLDKYLLAALEMKPTEVWREPKQPRKQKQCLLTSLRTKPDAEEQRRQYVMVDYLLKLGANPNYIPPQCGYRFGSKTRLSPVKNSDIPSSLRRYCTALERAIIIGNEKVVDLLLKSQWTSTMGSFAIHLAAKSGNVPLLQKLLLMYNEEQKRFGIPDTQLTFISILPNGILGAACVSEKPSFGLFKTINETAPGILKGTKLMTAKLLGSLRPVMLEILQIHDHLPLVLFIQKWQQHLKPEEKEAIVCFILHNGSYPVEMRVKKTSFKHPACEFFRAAQVKRMWNVIAILLKRSGSTLMKCLLGFNENKMRCREYLFNRFGEGYLILKHIFDCMSTSPIEILSMLTNACMKAITSADQDAKEQLVRRMLSPYGRDSSAGSSSSAPSPSSSDVNSVTSDDASPGDTTKLFLEQLVRMLWWRRKPSNMLLFDQRKKQRFPSFLSDEKMPDASEFGTLSIEQMRTVGNKLDVNASVLKELIQLRTLGLFQKRNAKDASLEERLIGILQRLHRRHIHISVLHLAVWFGEHELVEHIVKANCDTELSHTDMAKAVDLAAWKNDKKMVHLLTKHGAVPTAMTVLCACLGIENDQELHRIDQDDYNPLTTYLRKQNHHLRKHVGYVSREDTGEEKTKLGLIKYICESIRVKDIPPRNQEALQVAAMDHNWTLVDYFLDQGTAVLEPPDFKDNADSSLDESEADPYGVRYSDAVKTACIGLQEILSLGTADLALKALKSIHEVKWDDLPMKNCIISAIKSGNVSVVEHIVKEVLCKVHSKPGKTDEFNDMYRDVIPHLCKNNDISNVKLMLQHLKDERVDLLEIINLNQFDSISTPNYALRHKHWKLAELLLLNGAFHGLRGCEPWREYPYNRNWDVYKGSRSRFPYQPNGAIFPVVPDLDTKRTFQSLPEKTFFCALQSDSRNVAIALGSKGTSFPDSESLLDLRKTASPCSHIEPPKLVEKGEPIQHAMLKRVKYLIGLTCFTTRRGGTIFHTAVIVGDIHLMTDIIAQPMFTTMMKQVDCVSPVVLGISNQHIKAVQLCLKYPELISDPVTAAERASEAIISLVPGIDTVIAKLWRRKRLEKEQELKKRVCSLYDSLRSHYFKGIELRHFPYSSQCSLEELANYVLDILFLSKEEQIPNVVLTVLALLSKPSLFERLERRMKLFHRKPNLTSMPIIEGWTTADLICHPNNDKEPRDVYECLKHVFRTGTLQFAEDTLELPVMKQIITYALLNDVAIIMPMVKELIAHTSKSVAKTDSFVELLKLAIEPSKDKHGESVLHCLAKTGDAESMYCILQHLKKGGIQSHNIRDASGSSPLWYALAHKHWKLAELLLMNGASLSLIKAFPDFEIRKTCYAATEGPSLVTRPKQFPGLCNNSDRVGLALQSNSGVFMTPSFERLKEEVSSQPNDDSPPVTVLGAKETVSRIPELLCNNSRRVALALQSKSEVFLKPILKQFKEEMSSQPKEYPSSVTVKDAMSKRVQYLMNLSHVGSDIKGNIFHAAVIAGDTALVKDLMTQPMFSSMMKTTKGLPPFALAVSNLDIKMVKQIQTSSKLIKDPITIVEKASQAIISLIPGIDGVIEKLRKWKKVEKDADVKEKISSLHTDIKSHHLKGEQMKFLLSRKQCPLEEIVKEVLDILPLSHDVKIPDVLLIALALLCNPDIFVHLKGRLKNTFQRQSDVCSRIVIHGCTLTDLIILLQGHKDEVSKSLTVLAMIGTLHVDDNTLVLSVRMNHVSFLKIVAESCLKRFPEKMLTKQWIDVFTFAASKGKIDLLRIMLTVFEKNSPSNISQLLNEVFCVTSSQGHTNTSEALLTFATNTGTSNAIDINSAAVKAARRGMTSVLKTLLELFQRNQLLSDDMLSTLLELTGFSGSVSAFRVVLEFGDEPLREKKATLTKCVPRALMNGIKKGHVEFCLYILETLPDVSLTEVDSQGATILHYACKWGTESIVTKILEKSTKLAEREDNEKRNPIDYARAMGQVALIKDLSETFKLKTTFKWTKEILHFGWLRYLLTSNGTESLPPIQSTDMLYPTISVKREAWTIEYALRQRNDEVALAMIFAAEGHILTAMTHSYAEAPLIHVAAKYGSLKVIDTLLTRIEEDQQTLRTILLTEIRGNIPLALAVQNKHKECVRLLIERQNTVEWVSKSTRETLFHVAALTGDKVVLEMLREKSDPQTIHLKNKFGMEAGQYSIALGHQHMTSLFFEQGFPTNSQHSSHKKTDYTCLDCLLDRCFGWSEVYLHQQKTSGPERNIWERGKTTTGYVSTPDSAQSHTLETLLQYAGISKDVRIVKSALACMGYKDDVDLARLFLLQSKGNDQMSNISLCLTKGWESTTIAILEHTKATLDLPSVLDSAIVTHSVDVVKFILQKYPEVINKEIEGITPLQTAVSLQMYDIYGEILSLMQLTDTDQSHFANLSDIKVCLPIVACWKTGISHPGDETWIQSMADARLSEASFLMLKTNNPELKKKVESSATVDSMLPETIIGKPLKVDLDSFRNNKPVAVSDSWLMTVIASYLTTLTSVLNQAHNLEEMDKIEIICLSTGTGTPFKELDGRTLKDHVALDRTDQADDGEPILSIASSERVPNELHNDAHFKVLVEKDILSEAEILVHEIVGHRVKIDVDWASFDTVDIETRSACYSLLAGRDLNSKLGGLVDILGRCKELYEDILALHGDTAVACIQDLFTPLQTIVVSMSTTMPLPRKIMFFPCEESMPWVFNYKNDKFEFVVQNFPMYSRLKAYQTICVHSAGGVCKFSQDVETEAQISWVDVSVDWKSFSSLGDTSSMSVFGRNGLRMVIYQLIVGLKRLLWYTTKPKKLILRNAPAASEGALLMDGEEITLTLFPSQSQSGLTSGGIDIKSQLHIIEVKQQIEKQIETGGQFAGFTELTGRELNYFEMPSRVVETMVNSRQPEEIYFKNMVDTQIIDKAEELMTELVGHTVKVKVDWSSFNPKHSDDDITVYNMLTGRDPSNELGGLLHVIRRCTDLNDDIFALQGQTIMESLKDLFTPVREIIIKHTDNLTRTNKTMFCLIDQSMPWYINFKDGVLGFVAESFPLYTILKACHSFCINMTGGVKELERNVVDTKPTLEVSVDWKSFGNVGDTQSLSILGRNGIRLEMLRLAAGLKHLLRYKFRARKILLKNAQVSSEVGLKIDGDVLIMTVYAQRSHTGGWTSTGLDIYAQLKEMEVQHVLTRGAEEDLIPKKDLVLLAEKSGFRFLIPVEKRKWLEEIAQKESRQLRDPLELLQLYAAEYYTSSPVEKIEQELVEGIEVALTMCPGVWPVQPKVKPGNLKTLTKQLEPGLWCWVTMAELGNGISHDKFLVNVRSEGSCEYDFKLLLKGDAKSLPTTKVSGVWYHQPFDKMNDMKTIGRLQLISFLGVLYHITDPFEVLKLLQNIPSKIQRGLTRSEIHEEEQGTLFLPFDSWTTHLRIGRPHFDVDCNHGIALHQCWKRGSELGINIVIDTDDLRRCGFKPASIERIAMDVSTTLETFTPVVDLMTHQKNDLLSTQGVLRIGSSNMMDDHTPWTAQGMARDDEHFGIYPLSESDLYLLCDPALAVSEENVQKNEQEPFAVRFVFPKLLPKRKGSTRDPKKTYVSPRFANILNVTLGHMFVSDKSRKLLNMIDDLSARHPPVTFSFLEPTPDDIFLPYAETVFNNITTAFSYYASKSKGFKHKFPKTLTDIHVVEKTKDSDSKIVKFDKDVLTIFAVHKGRFTPIADMIRGLDNTFGKGLLSSNCNLDDPQLAKFTVEGYKKFKMRVSDFLGATVTDSLLKRLAKNKLLKLTLSHEGKMEKVLISSEHVSKESLTLNCDWTGFEEVKLGSNCMLSVSLNERDLYRQVGKGCEFNAIRIETGKSSKQVSLNERENPTLLLLPRHENICLGVGSNDTKSQDQKRNGNCVTYIDMSTVEFEVVHKATFRVQKDTGKSWLTVATSNDSYFKGAYSFRMAQPKPHMFIRARCKLCKSLLELHSETSTTYPGEYLHVVYDPHSTK